MRRVDAASLHHVLLYSDRHKVVWVFLCGMPRGISTPLKTGLAQCKLLISPLNAAH